MDVLLVGGWVFVCIHQILYKKIKIFLAFPCYSWFYAQNEAIVRLFFCTLKSCGFGAGAQGFLDKALNVRVLDKIQS